MSSLPVTASVAFALICSLSQVASANDTSSGEPRYAEGALAQPARTPEEMRAQDGGFRARLSLSIDRTIMTRVLAYGIGIGTLLGLGVYVAHEVGQFGRAYSDSIKRQADPLEQRAAPPEAPRKDKVTRFQRPTSQRLRPVTMNARKPNLIKASARGRR